MHNSQLGLNSKMSMLMHKLGYLFLRIRVKEKIHKQKKKRRSLTWRELRVPRPRSEHLGEDVLDGGALKVCPFNHFAGSRF